VIDRALAFAQANIAIFPVRLFRDGDRLRKAPYIREWPTRASADARQVGEWWRQWPDAVPGIPLARYGRVVVDADRHPGKPDGVAAFAELGPMPPHPIVATASGGEHHFFAQPDPPIAGKPSFAPGIDLLGVGRFVVGYELAPLLALEAPELPTMFLPVPHSSANNTHHAENNHHGPLMSGTARSVPKALYSKVLALVPLSDKVTCRDQRRVLGLLRMVAQKCENRNNTINIAGFCFRELIDSGVITRAAAESLLFDAATVCGYVAKDGTAATIATIRSGLGCRPTVGHVCALQHSNKGGGEIRADGC